jgi:hypothetical protein
MTDTWIIRITLFLAGVVPFALAGGALNDATVWPWSSASSGSGGGWWSYGEAPGLPT